MLSPFADFAYDPTTGLRQMVTAPDGGILSFSYDGARPIGNTWTGAVSGEVSWTFDPVDTTTGAITQRIDYDEFGQVTLDNEPWVPAVRVPRWPLRSRYGPRPVRRTRLQP